MLMSRPNPDVTGPEEGSTSVRTCAVASLVTSKVRLPTLAPVVAVAVTVLDDELAVTASQAAGWVSVSAAVCSADRLLLTDW